MSSERARVAYLLGLSEERLIERGRTEQSEACKGLSATAESGRIELCLGLPPGTLAHGPMQASLSSVAMARNGRANLLPPHDFSSSLYPGRRFRLDRQQGARIAADLTALCAKTPLVIDYDHATLTIESSGVPAPAAGWITHAAWSPADGLVADVEWTLKAREAIGRGQFRFASPVIQSTGDQVTGVALAALVRQSPIPGLREVQTS